MKPINEFPYEAGRRVEAHPMNKRMLLLKMDNSGIGNKFALGYYEAVHDIFMVSMTGHQPTGCYFDEIPAVGNELDHKDLKRAKLAMPYDEYRCIMPERYIMPKGQRCITHFIQMDDALDIINEHNLEQRDFSSILDGKVKFLTPYLVCTKDNRIFIAEVSCFADGIGCQFSGYRMASINGDKICLNSSVPREIIKYVVDLNKFEEITKI